MKLYVKNSQGQTTYLSIIAPTRADLAAQIGSSWFTLHGETFHVNNVRATSDTSGTASGAAIGGLVGLIGGPIGLIIGGVLGGALGNESDKSEDQKVKYFNDSYAR
jgi:hypothetical protein